MFRRDTPAEAQFRDTALYESRAGFEFEIPMMDSLYD